MSETKDIAHALQTRLAAFAGIAADRIAWPGVDFTPPGDGLWIEVSFHANEPAFNEIGYSSPVRRDGWLQMSVVTRRGAGVIGVLDMAEDLADHFPAGAVYTSNGVDVRITRKPGPESPFEDDGLIRCPVKARYLAIA